jgi:pimeloyl-ACP methyl ester carboxylesterase
VAGGPGESGVDYILGWGKQLGNRWEYNPVSFDPRGVQWTAPILACDYTLSEDSARLRRRQARKKNTLGDLSDIFDENLEYNELCSANNDYTAARYVGATAVVQDMMHFTELQAAQRDEDPSASLINFYGVSYGTLVGQVLVAMYPDRIRRVLLDANVYGVAHFNGYEPTSIGDYAHAIHLFCELCFEAGEDWCPLAQGANSTEAIQQRFDNALQELRDNPVADEVTGYVFDDNAFLSETYQYFYFPDSGYSKIANMTLAALKGKGAWPEPEEEESSNAPKTGPDAIHIITAVDMGGRYPWSTYESWKAATEELAATAPYGAKGFAETNGYVPGMLEDLHFN